MHLIDDGVFHRTVERTVTLPVVIRGVDNDGTHRTCHVVDWPTCDGAFPKGVCIPASVGVKQYLVLVEPVARSGIVRPIHSIRVMCPGRKPTYKHVPEMEALIDGWIELDRLKRFTCVMRGEKKEFHSGGMCREE